MKYEITCNVSYAKKGLKPFEVSENLDAQQLHDDQLYEFRKSVRIFIKNLMSSLDDAPFRATLYCITEENYISDDTHDEEELRLVLPKGTSLLDFEDILLQVLDEVKLKHETLLSAYQVNNHLIIQIISAQ